MHNPKTLLVLGLSTLIIAGILNMARRLWLPALGDGAGDAMLGLVYGVSFGLLLLSIWHRTHVHR